MSDQDNNTMDGVPPAPGPASLSAALTARYDLLGELGRGGMGIVYKARDRETGEIVALKVLKPEIAADESAMERFKNELRLARKITHKNVCRIHEFSRAGDSAYISMEYVEGESLRQILNRFGALPLPKIVHEICAGLREAHAQGVVHRDLKPENILIARDGTVKVMDFGVARSLEGGMTKAGALVGTPAYMSPEQAEGKPADARSDIYSLGLALYEMFTGATTFKGDTPFAIALKQIHEMPQPPREVESSLPAHIERAILKCLEKNPAKRFQSVGELDSAMEHQVDVAPADVSAPAEAELLPPPAESSQWQASDSWMAGGGVLAAIVFLAIFSIVYPFSSLRIRIGPEEAVEKALVLVRKFEPAAANGRAEPYWRWWQGGRPATSFVSLPEIQQAIVLIFKYQSASRPWLQEYPVKVRALGLPEANRQLVYDASWEVRVDLGQGRGPASVGLRTDGSLCYLNLPRTPNNTALPLPSREQARRDGIAYVREVFGTDVSSLEPKFQNLPQATAVSWELPGPLPGLKRVISVRFGHGGQVVTREDFHSRHESQINDEGALMWGQDMALARHGGLATVLAMFLTLFLMLVLFAARRLYQGAGLSVILVALCITLCFGGILILLSIKWDKFELPAVALLLILALVLLFARRLYQEPRRSTVLIALCITLSFSGIWLQDHDEAEFTSLVVPAVAIAIFLFHFALFATAEDYLWRRLRSRVVTWFLLVRRPGEARAAGLSMLRGCALGFIFLATHTLVVYALGSLRLAGANMLWLEAAVLSGRSYLPLYALSYAVLVTISRVWCLFGFPAALAAGITRRPLALVGVPAALCAFMVFYLPGTTPTVAWLAFFFAAFQGLVFSLVFYRYDLLTLASAVFTIEMWLLVYPVWTIFSAIQPWQTLAMLPWFLLLVAGAIIYLRPQLQTARRHLAAVFE